MSFQITEKEYRFLRFLLERIKPYKGHHWFDHAESLAEYNAQDYWTAIELNNKQLQTNASNELMDSSKKAMLQYDEPTNTLYVYKLGLSSFIEHQGKNFPNSWHGNYMSREQLLTFLESKTALETDMYVVAKLRSHSTEILRKLYKEYERLDSIELLSNTYIISVPYPHQLKDMDVEVVITEGEFQHKPELKKHEQRLRIYLSDN